VTPPRQPGASRARPEWQPEGEAFWWARQEQLHLPTYGDQLTRAEVLFMERFETLGHRAEWIPKTRAAKTPDFYWTTLDGRPWDIKSPSLDGWDTMTPKQQYKRIAGRISEDAPFKKRVVVDLSRELLLEGLAWELSQYNEWHRNAPDHQVMQIMVLSRAGLYTVGLT